MNGPKKTPAFTLAELLVVIIILGMMLSLGGGFTTNVRNTFIAQQAIKQYIQQARILRRKSMLITRNSGEDEWVHGIGMQFRLDQDLEQWRMYQIKLLDKNPSVFYKKFPTQVTEATIKIEEIESLQKFIIPAGFTIKAKDLDSEFLDNKSCIKITVLYESINGKMHAYCQTSPTAFFTEHVIGGLGTDSQEDNPNIQLSILYPDNNGRYETNIILGSNGEIKTIQNEQ